MQAAWPEELHGLQSTPKDSQSAPYYELMIYAQRLQVTSRIRQRYANTTPAIRQCHASATPTLRQCSASATSVLRQCYAKDIQPAHKLCSVLTLYTRHEGLTKSPPRALALQPTQFTLGFMYSAHAEPDPLPGISLDTQPDPIQI